MAVFAAAVSASEFEDMDAGEWVGTARAPAAEVRGRPVAARSGRGGELVCWGTAVAGKPDFWTPPAGTFTQVDVSDELACALRTDGTAACWGIPSGVGAHDPQGGRCAAVAAGILRACGLRPSQEIECWGSNSQGQTDAPAGKFRLVGAGAYSAGRGVGHLGRACARPSGSIWPPRLRGVDRPRRNNSLYRLSRFHYHHTPATISLPSGTPTCDYGHNQITNTCRYCSNTYYMGDG